MVGIEPTCHKFHFGLICGRNHFIPRVLVSSYTTTNCTVFYILQFTSDGFFLSSRIRRVSGVSHLVGTFSIVYNKLMFLISCGAGDWTRTSTAHRRGILSPLRLPFRHTRIKTV